MYLKSIEVQGFKSFANKTVFQFHHGITGIVGPNGSGKSNVADAVRWVLGEQRARQLRGGSMQDVIFAGTQARKPLGYAYVALTLDNSDHVLATEYTEVKVARRLYRSGESEYLLNGSPCRLKDVYELFFDTGIGKEGYSIIGQGQIDRILSGKPEERRELFDEAAGIVKFKHRKAEAQKKLDDQQQNLLRISDILSELDQRIGPLERQAEKARIYLKKKDELKAYEINSFLTAFHQMRDDIDKTREKYETASHQQEEVRQEYEQIGQGYHDLQEKLRGWEAEGDRIQEELTAKKLEKQQTESRIELLRERIRQAEGRAASQEEQQSSLEKDMREHAAGEANLEEILSALERQNGELASKIEKQEEQLSGLRSRIGETRQMLDQLGEERIALLKQRSSIQADMEKADALLEQNTLRLAGAQSEILRLRSEESGQSSTLGELDEKIAGLDQQIDEITGESNAIDEQLPRFQEELGQLNTRMEETQLAYHRKASRLETLRGIAERYDGYGSSIRHVMDMRGRESGLLGVVADLIRTRQEYETAIEIALGGAIQNIVTENEDVARRMIARLKAEKLGRATFLPLDAIRPAKGFTPAEALKETGVIAPASELVECEKKYRALASHLLGRTLVTDTVEHALAIARKYRYSLRIVTLDGELLTPGGALTGGAFKNSSNLLGRRREIDELKAQTEDLKQLLQNLRDEIDSKRAERSQLRQQMMDLSKTLQELYLKQNTLRTRKEELAGQKSRTLEDSRRIDAEVAQLEESSAQIRSRKEEAERKAQELLAREKELEAESARFSELLMQQEKEETEEAPALEKIRLSLSVGRQKETYLKTDLERVRQEKADLEDQLERLREDMACADEDEKHHEEEIASLKNGIGRLDEEMADLEEQLRKILAQREEGQKKQQTMFARREELSGQNALLEKECYRLSSQIEKLEERREERISYMWEEYGLTYSTALAQKRDDLGKESEWKRRISALKGEIHALGNVNVNAIEEYREVSERHTFLTSQHDDLVEAQKKLEKIIADLDSGMRRQFTEQFVRIREEFDKTFRELFGGGGGSLELVEGEDILDAGIRIIAQPPGKKLQNMMQMSGGEKALTAIALLFAIQNLKPSPFCLLDEIEAALDENNVDRYAAYLRKLTKHTQFIIITHRRGTMAAADRLYGITMQEKGISALVSVSLVEQELDN